MPRTSTLVIRAERLRLVDRRRGALLLVRHRRVEGQVERHLDHVQGVDA